jgi:hypothetical protein
MSDYEEKILQLTHELQAKEILNNQLISYDNRNHHALVNNEDLVIENNRLKHDLKNSQLELATLTEKTLKLEESLSKERLQYNTDFAKMNSLLIECDMLKVLDS